MKSKLKQSIGLWTATFYGLGTIVGAGIFVLIGKVADYAGMFSPVSFLIAAVLAIFSAFSYAELSSRYPESAGAALYVHKAFNKIWLSRIVGFLIFVSGIVSAGVMANGFASYFSGLFPLVPERLSALGILLVLGGITFLGISMSGQAIMFITILSLAGLLYIIWVARGGFMLLPTTVGSMIPNMFGSDFSPVILGSFLAFYAYIGFEDLANVAEEMKNPTKDMPKAIITIMIASTCLYLLVALVTVLGMPLAELQASERPLAELYLSITGDSPILISIVSLLAVMNSIIVQIIMASRLMYGMSEKKWLPGFLGYVHPRTQVPVTSTLIVLITMIVITLTGTLQGLANLTSFIILSVFALINAGLLIIKRREYQQPETKSSDHFSIHIMIPLLGVIVNVFFIVYKLFTM